jgi:hypothetical protein
LVVYGDEFGYLKSFGCLKFYEMELSSIAKAGNKKIGGLETGEERKSLDSNTDKPIMMNKQLYI